jgi:hypothetical protein
LDHRILSHTAQHAFYLFDLPPYHADPFDRQIVAQAVCERTPVVTCDEKFTLYKDLAILFSQVEPCNNMGTEMDFSMAQTAKGDEIFVHIVSEMASRLQMMYLKTLGTPASLTSPAIAPEDVLTKRPVRITGQATPRTVLSLMSSWRIRGPQQVSFMESTAVWNPVQ